MILTCNNCGAEVFDSCLNDAGICDDCVDNWSESFCSECGEELPEYGWYSPACEHCFLDFEPQQCEGIR